MFLIYADRGGRAEERSPIITVPLPSREASGRFPDAGYVGGFQTRPQEYEERLIRFYDGALLGAG